MQMRKLTLTRTNVVVGGTFKNDETTATCIENANRIKAAQYILNKENGLYDMNNLINNN